MTAIRDYAAAKARVQVALQPDARPVAQVKARYADRRPSIQRG